MGISSAALARVGSCQDWSMENSTTPVSNPLRVLVNSRAIWELEEGIKSTTVDYALHNTGRNHILFQELIYPTTLALRALMKGVWAGERLKNVGICVTTGLGMRQLELILVSKDKKYFWLN